MKKNQLTTAHIVLFVVSFLAVSLTIGSQVRAYLKERNNESQAANQFGGMGGNRGAAGQGGFNPQQMAARRLEQMTQQLLLTTEQVAKVQEIQARTAPLTKAIFDDATLSRQQKREKMRPLRAESDAQIRQILTPEQQSKFDEMQAQRRARFGGGAGGANGGVNGAPGMTGALGNPAPPAPPTSSTTP